LKESISDVFQSRAEQLDSEKRENEGDDDKKTERLSERLMKR